MSPTGPAVPVAGVWTNDGTRVRATFGWGSPGQPIVKFTTKGMGVAQVPAKKDKSLIYDIIWVCAKLSQQRSWPCHEDGLIKIIPAIPKNLFVRLKS